MAGATSWIVACAKCGLRWKRPEPMSPISEYERQTVESRPCPGCGATRFPAAKSGPPYTDSAFVEQPDPRRTPNPLYSPASIRSRAFSSLPRYNSTMIRRRELMT